LQCKLYLMNFIIMLVVRRSCKNSSNSVLDERIIFGFNLFMLLTMYYVKKNT